MSRSHALAEELSSPLAESGGMLPRRFGNFLLVDRLGTDPLGESYRAANVATGWRPMLLRQFRGEGLEPESFWQAMNSRRLDGAARRPPLAARVDLGLTDDTPWVAYDCLPGRSLAEVVRRSRAGSVPLTSEDALFVAERVALALRAVHELRCDGRRIAHGFLVPELIWISAEGEVRLLGLEAAAGLSALPPSAGPRRAAAGYLAPEVAAGGSPERGDDLYSLGAVLQFLLSGEVPLPTGSDPGPMIEGATRRVEPSELRPEVDRLLREALAPRDERADLEGWARRLEKVTFDGGRSPSTFRLAFHMDSLFGPDLDGEGAPVAAPEDEPEPALAAVQPAADPSAPPAEPRDQPPGSETLQLPELTPPDDEAPLGPLPESPETPALTLPPAAEALLPPGEPLADAASAAPADADAPETPAPEPLETTPVPLPRPRAMARSRRSSRWPLVAAAAALLLAAVLTTGYLLRDRLGWAAAATDEASAAHQSRIATASTTATEPAFEEVDLDTPSAEEIQRQVGELVEERADSLGSAIEERYSSRLDTLRREVEDARRASARERTPAQGAEASAPPVEPPARPSLPPASPPVAEERRPPVQVVAEERRPPVQVVAEERRPPVQAVAEERRPPVQAVAEERRPPVQAVAEERRPPVQAVAAPTRLPAERTAGTADLSSPAGPSPAEAAKTVPPAPVEAPVETPVVKTTAPSTPPPSPIPTTRPRETVPAEPAAVRPGDLVEAGPGVVAPTLVRHPQPAYPPAAQRLRRAATVKLRVLVDENGEVAEVEPAGPRIGLGFDAAALRAARGTLWRPAEKDGVQVRMWVDLSIAFRPD